MSAVSLTKADLVPDGVLMDASEDALDHAPVAKVVAELAASVETPANIALFGRWGSGKSSIYPMLEQHLVRNDSDVVVVRYDAWKFGGHSLHRNFLTNLAQELKVGPEHYLANLYNGTETTRLRLGRFVWHNKASLFGACLIAFIAGACWVAISAWAAWKVGSPTEFRQEVYRFAPSGAVVFGAVIAGLLLSNQTLASAVEKRTRSPLQDSDQFSNAFENLVERIMRRRLWRRRVNRIVIFVDELDRCSPEDVVSTLIDLKTFLDHRGCVFIVAADREVLETALNSAPQAKPVRPNEPYYSTAGAFLDKIFQHQLTLPPVRPEAMTNFAMRLADAQDGLWSDLRKNTRKYEDVVYSLVPAHVQSPRRVKILLNNFSTNVRVLQSRHLDWEARAVQIAVLTVLETEFSSVVKDLSVQPRLLEALVDDAGEYSNEIVRLKSIYSTSLTTDSEAAAAGPLLADEDGPQAEEARRKLNEQLDAYLRKVKAAGITFPTLDLIYLQTAGHAEGLADPDLATALDFAADTAPRDLVGLFAGSSSADRRAAIRFLATQANTTFGPGRANLVESACRIAESMDLDDLRPVAGFVASTFLSEVPKGRWRPEATPGAMLLGLLDSTIRDPLALLGGYADPIELAEAGFLDRIVRVLSALDGDRADGVRDLVGAAYASHPDALHEAVRTLPSAAANSLWDSQAYRIRRAIRSLSSQVTTTSSSDPKTLGTPPRSLSSDDSASLRYDSLLLAISERETPATRLGVGALELGLTTDADELLYQVARDHVESLKVRVIDDPAEVNRLALVAVQSRADTELVVGETDDLIMWVGQLDRAFGLAGGKPEPAAARIVQFVKVIDPIRAHSLVPALAALAYWLDQASANRLADTIATELGALPLSALDTDEDVDSAELTRKVYYDLLDVLSNVVGERAVQQIRERDLRNLIDGTELDSGSLERIVKHLGQLSAQGATDLDSYLGKHPGKSNQRLSRTQLRIAARQRASKRSLPVRTFLSALTDTADATKTLAVWLATNPPLSDVEQAVKKANPTSSSLGRYANQRSLNDRSKLWITLYDAHYLDQYLKRVSESGVNETAVQHCRPAIIGADLPAQKKAVDRLLTADLSVDPGAKRAATHLAADLLRSGLVGSGQSAARIVLNAKGAGSGLKPMLRKALDTYADEHPSGINKGDLRRLEKLGLLTKRKKSRLAEVLDWFSEKVP